jgi:hypothetical protein
MATTTTHLPCDIFERIRSLARTLASLAHRARAGDPDYPPVEVLGWVETLAAKIEDELSRDVGDEDIIDLTGSPELEDDFMAEPEWAAAA